MGIYWKFNGNKWDYIGNIRGGILGNRFSGSVSECCRYDLARFYGWLHVQSLVKGSLGGETSVLRTFRMSGK